MNNFIDFGIRKSKKKKIYESLSGELYDTYMLGRYFKDIYNLDSVISGKKKFHTNLLHDTKDLKFNLINFLLLLRSKKKKFYEFGFTLYEKIFYFKFFNIFFQKKLTLKKIKFNGNEISDQFIFFCQNFYKDLKIEVSNNIKKISFSNSVFFSKGVTLLYEKKNIFYIQDFVKYCDSGSFDISLYPKKKTLILETGYKLYYPSIKEFINIIKSSNKYFFYRNKKKIGDKLYLEVLFGEKGLDKEINSQLIYFSKNNQNKNFRKYLSLNKKFYELNITSLK